MRERAPTVRWGELARAKGWLDAFRPLPPAVAEELGHRFEVRLTHHSTAIEGNTLTQSETQIVLEKGITIGGKSVLEHLEVVGHREALDFVRLLASGDEPFGEREIREIHSLVVRGQGFRDEGAYRTLDVMAAETGFRYPSHLQVPELIAGFAAWLASAGEENPVARASQAHLRFVTIHPFRDGNGRVGRLLLNLLLLRAGYPIAVLPVQRRAASIDALAAAQAGGGEEALLGLVADAAEASLRETLAVCLSADPGVPDRMGFGEGFRVWMALGSDG